LSGRGAVRADRADRCAWISARGSWPQRAFYGNQFGNTFPMFLHYGVRLGVPEVGGPIDPLNEAHNLIMSVFGGVSKGERNLVRIRVRAGMAALAECEGRLLGGRPPYGYLLADAGAAPQPSESRRRQAAAPGSRSTSRPQRSSGGSSPSSWPASPAAPSRLA
jgi:hypothetical protein